jgi:hypothetical protein
VGKKQKTEDRGLKSEVGMRNAERKKEDRRQTKEGERLRRWEGVIKPGRITEGRRLNSEVGMRNAERKKEDGRQRTDERW